MLNQKFYFQTIRKLTGSILTFFSDIEVQRFSNNGNQGTSLKSITVPIRYAGNEKSITQNREKKDAQSVVRVEATYPRMSLSLIDYKPDMDRKLPSMVRQNYIGSDTNVAGAVLSQLRPVPVDLAYELVIETKYLNDSFQIIEQIMPNFTPSFNLNINDIPELGIVKDIPLIIAGVNFADQYEGDPAEKRTIRWTINFVCKAYVYPPISDVELIKKVIATIYPNSAMEDPSTGRVTVYVDPLEANIDDPHDIITEIEET